MGIQYDEDSGTNSSPEKRGVPSLFLWKCGGEKRPIFQEYMVSPDAQGEASYTFERHAIELLPGSRCSYHLQG